MLIATIIITAVLAILGIIILIGKGDMLIAGYNTASEKERQKYHIKRLRLIFGILPLLLATTCFFLFGKDSVENHISFVVLATLLAIVSLVLANTWAKKKYKKN